MAKSINLTGTSGASYNLDELKKNSRTSGDELAVQVWKWNPNLPSSNAHSKPNPPSPKIGQIWVSKLVEIDSDDFESLKNLEG